MNLGDTIKALRRRNGASQEDLAEAVGVSRVTIGRWEASASEPSHYHIAKLSRHFGVDLQPPVPRSPISVSAQVPRRTPRSLLIAVAALVAILGIGATTIGPAAAAMAIPTAIMSVFNSGPTIEERVLSGLEHKAAKRWGDALSYF